MICGGKGGNRATPAHPALRIASYMLQPLLIKTKTVSSKTNRDTGTAIDLHKEPNTGNRPLESKV